MSESVKEGDSVKDGVQGSEDSGASGAIDTPCSDGNSAEGPSNNTSIEFKVPNPIPQTVVAEQSKSKVAEIDSSSEKGELITTDSSINKNKLHSKLSPAEVLKNLENPLPYKEPVWGGLCTQYYKFEVLKNGTIIDNVDLTKKSFFAFGRLPSCDVHMDHPSLSRYHAVVQYCKNQNEIHEVGWYLYDLGSTHGTWLNKQKVKSRVYYRLKVGYVIRFGGSSRLHILQGPNEDQEEESDLSLTEMKELRERKKKEKEILKLAEGIEETDKTKTTQDACSWGFGDDAEDVDTVNPFASVEPENEELYIEDPKKSLKGFFEREGFEPPEYQITDAGRGQYQCTVELPVDSPSGEPLVAEATVMGKKKDAVVACALAACRLLDKMGELRKATHESRKKKRKNWEENDFYDSDEDTFLDRTGDIERKRQQRMQRLGKDMEQAQNYQTIVAELEAVEKEMQEIQGKLDKAKADAAAVDAEEGLDALDAFMANIKAGAMDTKTKMALKRRLLDLKVEQAKLKKLANVAKPADFKLTKSQEIRPTSSKLGSLVGKLKTSSHKQALKMNVPKNMAANPDTVKFEIEEEEDEEVVKDEDDLDREVQDKDDLGRKDTDTEKESDKNVNDIEEKEEIDDLESKVKGKAQGLSGSVADNSAAMDDVTHEACEGDQRVVENVDNMTSFKSGDKRKSAGDKDNVTPVKRKKDETESYTEKEGIYRSMDGSTSGDTVKSGKGPALPPTESVTEQTRPKKTAKKPVKKKKSDQNCEDLASKDPDYETWLPPENQTGDGKTSLNAKFGY